MDPSKRDDARPPPVRGRARGRVTVPRPTPETTLPPTPNVEAMSPTRTVPQAVAPVPAAAPEVEPTPQVTVAESVPATTSTAATSARDPTPTGSQPHAQMEKLRIEGSDAAVAQSTSLILNRYTYRTTKPIQLEMKQSSQEATLKLVANYFEASTSESWAIHQYAVSFDPPLEEEQTLQRRALFKTVVAQLPANLFDGLMLFTVSELPQCPTVLLTTDKFTNNPVTITIDCHKAVDRREPVCFQIYNIFVRNCLEHCKFTLMGRKYYDPNLKEDLKRHDLEVWPGFATSLRYFETQLLLNVEMVSKVVRKKNVYEIMQDIRFANKERKNEEAIRKLIADEVEGRIVMTPYNNNRTYPIEMILWDEKASDTFPWKDGSTKDYATYYKEKYGIKLQHLQQPLLLAAQKEKDLRRRKDNTFVKLVPETCYATGLTDSMRSNFNLMTDLGKITHVMPTNRVVSLKNFIRRFTGNDMIQQEMAKWNIRINDANLVRVPGRQLKEEKIYQGAKEYGYDAFSRGLNFRDHLHEPLTLTTWLAVVPSMFVTDFNKFAQDMQTVSRGMNFQLGKPRIVTVAKPMGAEYLRAVETAMNTAQGKLQMVFLVLSNNRLDVYSEIKKKLTSDWALPSQCCLSKNLKKGLSVATKIVVQMSCKIGGVPWIIRNPFKENICVMGFDVYHSGSMEGRSYGAIVATTNVQLSKSCSFITAHKHRDEISKNMGEQITKCLKEYQMVNGCLPTRIFFYRDGVGEGQVDIVYDTELKKAKEAIAELYKANKIADVAKLTYVIVSKRINTRFMVDKGNGVYDNPPPGTIVDDVVTLHYRYDFFLVSQKGRQGTISPCNYNIIFDDNGLQPARMQIFTFKLCHNYYNWNGTLSVPSVCQNAHKLAYITGEAIRARCKEELRHLPYYL